MTQYFFLDESGDPGRSSTSHFTLALVQLARREPLKELALAREALNLSPSFEFKYHKTTKAQNEVFFRSIEPLAFRVRAVVVDKSQLPVAVMKLRGRDFIVDWTTRLILRASELDIADDVLIMDGAVPSLLRALRIRLSEECRARQRKRPFAKFVSADSDREDGLQLADMIVGAVRQHVVEGNSQHFNTFARKVADLWNAP